jgi:RNA polymerase II subunit A small phosphatase-like protein
VDKEESALPAKKSVKPQSSHGRQSTPVEKADVSAGESSTADSREPNPFDEKAAAKANAGQRSSLVEKESTVPEEPEGSATSRPRTEEISNEGRSSSINQRPSQRKPRRTSNVDASHNPSEAKATGQHVAGSHSGDTSAQTATGQGSDQAQQDADVAVLDSDEVDDRDDPNLKRSAYNETHRQEASLPPPPPLSNAGKHIPPVPMVDPDKQQWLLPPIQPRFKNRKCLVLDLDETLVHSSFKVRSIIYHPSVFKANR